MRCPLLVLAVALPLAAPVAAAPHSHVITIDRMKFGPVPAELRKGDVIIWVNRDMFRHSATARNGSFNVDLPPGKQARMVIRGFGNIAFTCKYHPGMRGMLRVKR